MELKCRITGIHHKPLASVVPIKMINVKIEKPGDGVFVVKIAGLNRAAAERELQEFIAGRSYTRYVDHFNPNNQIIEIHSPKV